ncbi:MAG: hypothetical protein OIF48_07900 [Silicimonas sp.]|nr:hypothetical protein [Silicimonas sp.]
MRIFAMILGMLAAAPALADDKPGGLSIELNTITAASGACQLTFVAETSHPDGVEKVLFETVLFDKTGAVDRLTLFDFGKLPAGRPRVRQFLIPDLACADLGRILINGINECQAPGLETDACAAGLRATSRVDVELLG